MVKRTVSILLLFSLLFLLTGCIDLGVGNDTVELKYDKNGDIIVPEEYMTTDDDGNPVVKEEFYQNVWSDGCDFSDYYDLFDGVTLITYEGDSEDYDVEDSLFTQDTVVTGYWGDDDEEIPKNAYRLFALEMDKDVSLNDFSMSLYADSKGTLDMYFFIMDEIPDDIAHYDDNLLQERRDKNGNVMYDRKGRPIMEPADGVYHPDEKMAIAHQTVTLGDRTGAVSVTKWDVPGSTAKANTVSIKEGQYLVFICYSNTAYGKALGEVPISFQPVNMLFSIA